MTGQEQGLRVDYKLEEWKMLRDEISRKQALVYQIIFASTGLNFAIFSYGLQIGNMMGAVVVLLPIFLSNIGHYWILTVMNSAKRISQYIMEYFEEPGSFFWETSLRRFQSKTKRKGNRPIYTLIFYMFYVLSPMLSSIIIIVKFIENRKLIGMTVGIIPWVISYITYKLSTRIVMGQSLSEYKEIDEINFFQKEDVRKSSMLNRLAIYLLPPKETTFYNDVTHILGYDIANRKIERQDEFMKEFVGAATKYGCHITLIDTFTPNCSIENICTSIEKALMYRFKYKHIRLMPQGLFPYKRNRECLTIQFDDDGQERARELHSILVDTIQNCRLEIIEPEFLQMEDDMKQSILKYGGAFVKENYVCHLTLASEIKGEQINIFNKVKKYIIKKYPELFQYPLQFDACYLVQENKVINRWEVVRIFPFDRNTKLEV